MKIKPLGDRIVVRALEPSEEKVGSIYIPDTAKEKPQEGRVMAVGSGKRKEDGGIVPMDVKKDDRILFSKYAGSEVNVDGKEYLIMREDDILAVI